MGQQGKGARGNVSGTYTHEEDDVATEEERVEDLCVLERSTRLSRNFSVATETHLITRPLLELVLNQDEGQSRQHHDNSMTNITEHDGKEEREGNDGEQSGVDFLV